MDTNGPLQPLIKNPELANQEKATQNPAVHPNSHLSGSIKWVQALQPGHVYISSVFQEPCHP